MMVDYTDAVKLTENQPYAFINDGEENGNYAGVTKDGDLWQITTGFFEHK